MVNRKRNMVLATMWLSKEEFKFLNDVQERIFNNEYSMDDVTKIPELISKVLLRKDLKKA